MTDSTKLIDAVYEMCSAVTSACHRLEDVSDLLHEVGLTKLADKLGDMILPLSAASKRLNDAYGDDLTEKLDYSRNMAGNLLSLALKAATEKAGG